MNMKTGVYAVTVATLAMIPLCSRGADMRFKVDTRTAQLGGLGMEGTSGKLNIVYLKEDVKDARVLGQSVIWEDPSSKNPVCLTGSFGVLDAAIRTAAERSPHVPTDAVVEYVLAIFISRPGVIGLGPTVRPDFLKQLGKKVSEDIVAKIAAIAPPQERVWNMDGWKQSFTIVTERGAIEQFTFRGSTKPISLQECSVRIVAPEGTVPKFAYIP